MTLSCLQRVAIIGHQQTDSQLDVVKRIAHLIVNALIEEDSQRPPVSTDIVPMACVYFRRKIGQRSRLAGQNLAGDNVGGNILSGHSGQWGLIA